MEVRKMREMEVSDLVFESVYFKYWLDFRIREIQRRIQKKIDQIDPTTAEKLKQLRKELREAQRKKDYKKVSELSEKITELQAKIKEELPYEHQTLEALREKKREVERELRNYFKAIIRHLRDLRDMSVYPELVEITITIPLREVLREALGKGEPRLALAELRIVRFEDEEAAGGKGGEGGTTGAASSRPQPTGTGRGGRPAINSPTHFGGAAASGRPDDAVGYSALPPRG